jgi:hypothetical protein
MQSNSIAESERQPTAVNHSPCARRRQRAEDRHRIPLPSNVNAEHGESALRVEEVIRSTSPAISSDGTRGSAEVAVILIEVYAVEGHPGG